MSSGAQPGVALRRDLFPSRAKAHYPLLPHLLLQALLREAGAVAGDPPHALGWPLATESTAGATRQGFLGDLPAW